MSNNFCFWNYSDGNHSFMTKALIKSLRDNKVNTDFHVFSPDNISNATSTIHTALTQSDKAHYMFKVNLLKNLKNYNYDYYVFLDADSYCVRNPGDISLCFKDSAVHSFLESDCTSPLCKRKDWWGCSLADYNALMRLKGVTSEKIYNVNAGFFAVKKEAIDDFCKLCTDFWNFSRSKGYYSFTEEPPLAYATHMMCGDVEKHKQSNWYDLWCSDWIGNFSGFLPRPTLWDFEDYMTGEKIKVSPSIVHAMRSKDALAKLGRTI